MREIVIALSVGCLAVLVAPLTGAVTREAAQNYCEGFAKDKPERERPAFIKNCMNTITIDAPAKATNSLQAGTTTLASSILGVLVLAAVILLYFLPTYVASRRRKVNKTAIFVLNLFLGWTFLGWVIALVWAFTQDAQQPANAGR